MKSMQNFQAPKGSLFIKGGPTGILLIHSLGGSPFELKFVASALARQGYTVYCPVISGLTFGTDVSGLSTWRDWYSAAETALQALKSCCETILVGGASAGSVLALRLAARHQTGISGALLYAPTLAVNGWAIPRSIKLFHLVSDKWTARLFSFRTPAPYGIKDERVRNFALEAMKGEGALPQDVTVRGGGQVYEFFRLVRNVRRKLGRISQPAVIFHPRNDDQSDLKNTMTLQRELGGLVEVCVLDDSYHLVALDKQRQYVADRSIDFVARAVARAEAAAAASQRTAEVVPAPAATGQPSLQQGAAE